MRERCRYLALVAFGLVVGASVAFSQEQAPKTFYKKDYAIAPGAKGRDDPPPVERTSPRRSSQNRRDVTESPSSSRAPSSRAVKRRIILSVYVNSKEREHFTKVLNEVYRLHDEKRAFILNLYHIGDYTSVTPDITAELARRKLEIQGLSVPPPDAHVTMSPAWIITTREGTHIAEGIIQLGGLINEYGEYDPKKPIDPHSKNKVEEF
jgi:hypothetical protein